jgi:glycosyltransferase involved in cell wall biosynthesis
VTSSIDVLIVGDLESVHVRRLAVALRDSKLAVQVAGFEGEKIDGVSTHALGSRPANSDRRYALAIPRLAQLIRASEPRIVHAHYLTSFGLMATIATRLAYPLHSKSALVQTVWGTDVLVTARRSRIHRWLAMASLRAATLVTGDSLDLAHEVLRLAPGSRYIRFNFGPPDALLTADRHPDRIIVSSRRLGPDTRVDVILQGFSAAKDRSPNLAGWRLIVAGQGRDADQLRSMAQDRDDIQFTGQLSSQDLQSLLLRADLFVSIPRSDGTSASLLEAMAAGVMPVVNDLPANREWVDPGVGIVLPYAPVAEDVASAIEQAPDRSPNPAAIRDRVRAATWEREVARLTEAYRTIEPLHGARPDA